MKKYVIDDLDNWDTVLNTLEELKNKKLLDSHQDELIRLIRYNDNWRLREAALQAACHVRKPTRDLIDEVMNIVVREDVGIDARIFAVEAAESMIENAFSLKKPEKRDIQAIAAQTVQRLRYLRSCPQVPIFTSALNKALGRINDLLKTA